MVHYSSSDANIIVIFLVEFRKNHNGSNIIVNIFKKNYIKSLRYRWLANLRFFKKKCSKFFLNNN